MRLRLHPKPSASWTAEYQRLRENQWLREKLDRSKRLRDHRAYIDRHLPELKSMPPGLVIDIGPGPGEFLELSRSFGHEVLGVDAESGQGGMGNDYLRYSQLMTHRQDIPVHYVGLEDWLQGDFIHMRGSAVCINSRGSIEQALSNHLEGPPHHLHHRADRLNWKRSGELEDLFSKMFYVFRSLLRPGGVVMIHANGTGSETSQQWYDRSVLYAADVLRLNLAEHDPPRLHKWVHDV